MLLSVDEYKGIRNHFHINNWSMREFLINYNNTDVLPFLTALTNMSMYYADRDIDMFKEGISVACIYNSRASEISKILSPKYVFWWATSVIF